MRCPHCGSSHFMKNGWNGNLRKYKCSNCKKQFAQSTALQAQMLLPLTATPAPTPNICPKCGKPIKGVYRKGAHGKEHIVCPKEDTQPPHRFQLFESALTGALIR